jgi:hypothetical protein
MTAETVARIASGLTKAGRRAMKLDRFPDWSAKPREHRVYAALERRGLLIFRHIIAGQGDFHLTPEGLAVRAHLLANREQDHDA